MKNLPGTFQGIHGAVNAGWAVACVNSSTGKKKTLSIFAGKRSLQEKERPHYGNGMFYAGDILESGTVNKEAKKG